MNELEQLSKGINVLIPKDEDGFTGRECPNPECLGYFKIKLGTGLKGENLLCHCPYCGHTKGHDQFWTPEQIEYAKSVFINQVQKALKKYVRATDRKLRQSSRGSFIKLRIEYKGHPQPIRNYREKQLETKVRCEACALEYAIYGVFAFCPDCRTHNSLLILKKNLELAEKELSQAEKEDDCEFASYLIADALENSVSAFDGFGRATISAHAEKSSNPELARSVSFQSLSKARERVNYLFGYDLANGFNAKEWDFTLRCFQKRHLLAHKMGVIDEQYLHSTNDPKAVVGRKVTIKSDEVKVLIQHLKNIGEDLLKYLEIK
jgi:sarcosine oxidase delta subunit